MQRKLKIILLVGGTSSERYISKLTSKSIYDALKTLRHEVILLDPAYGDNQPTEPEKFFDENDLLKLQIQTISNVLTERNLIQLI